MRISDVSRASALSLPVLVLLLPPTTAPSFAQSPRGLLEAAPATARAHSRAVAAIRQRGVTVRPEVLREPSLALDLFDDARFIARRTSVRRPNPDTVVWHGQLDHPSGGAVTLVDVKGIVAGTVFVDGRLFEIGFTGGSHEVREMSPAAFPSDDPVHDQPAPALDAGQAIAAADGGVVMDLLAVWTPAARMAAGGTDAGIRSVIELAVANANAAYVHSQVNAQIRLVYAGEVSFSENTGDIAGDLGRLTQKGDGVLDAVHSLRDQYEADLVSLVGAGYTSGGACGVGWLMGSPSTGFASSAFNVVDQACAAGNLSLAHELGHNQGLHHDPPNAVGYGSPSYSYAYGYQDPSGAFRTVLSYGGATRVPYLSSPAIAYSGLPTGTSSQDNARALNNTAPTVASFRQSTTTEPPPAPTPPPPSPTCSFAVTPTSLSFTAAGGFAVVSVSTDPACGWSAESATGWVTVSRTSGTGSLTVTVSVSKNKSKARTTSATVAGRTISISQAAAVKSRGKR